ncbi:MAG: anti-sigma factor [Nocardiopsaceae bacterium]|nr:anti-sigma factor [Nocardiopsaceae bacterium]
MKFPRRRFRGPGFRGPGDHDPHALAGVYALNALDESERDRFERHLRGCRACEAEVRGFTATATALGLASAVEPPARLRERVMAAAAVTRQFPPETANQETAPRRRPVPGSWLGAWLVPRLGLTAGAVGLAVAAVASVVAVGARDQLNSVQAHAAVITAVLSAPDARIASASTAAGGTATVVVSASKRELVFTSAGLAPLPSSKVYELWFLGPGAPRRAGLVPASSGGSTPPVLASGLSPEDKIGVTVEPAGGTAVPTTTPIVILTQ